MKSSLRSLHLQQNQSSVAPPSVKVDVQPTTRHQSRGNSNRMLSDSPANRTQRNEMCGAPSHRRDAELDDSIILFLNHCICFHTV